jgi:disulfide bond formation protein DsbB
MNRPPIYTALALAVIVLAAAPVGIAVFVLGFVYGDSPCVMCWEQRIGMALIALTGLFILRYGPRPRYIGLATLIGAWGIFMGVRHSSLHVARDIGQGFSMEILGAHTYTWSAFIFWVCVVTMGLLLAFLKDEAPATRPGAFRTLETLAAALFIVVASANAVQAFASTGPPPFMGQGDPIRFSFNPKYWVWSTEEWDPSTPISWRGRWAASKPSLDGLTADPSAGPIAGTSALTVTSTRRLHLPVAGPFTDLAYDTASDRFLLTTAHGIFLTDGTLSKVVRQVEIDPGFSVDLATFTGATFLDRTTVMAVADNKSYVVLRESGKEDPVANFRFFVSSPEQFAEVSRSRLTTVRARLMYVMAATYAPSVNSVLTLTVPNEKNKRLVVSRFDRKDLTLSEEYLPKLAPDSGLTVRPKRSLDEFYVTGAAADGSMLHALSASYSTLLSLDLATRTITAARTVPGLTRPAGLAVKDGQFWILTDTGTLLIAR